MTTKITPGVRTLGTNEILTANINDDAVTLAKMAAGTAGNLIAYDATGNPAAVAAGTAGQVLTSGGSGVAPTMQTLTPSAQLLGSVVPSGVGVEFTGFTSADYRMFYIVLDDVGVVANPVYARLQLGDGATPTWRTGLVYSSVTINDGTLDPTSSTLMQSSFNLSNIGYTGRFGGRIELTGHAAGGASYPTFNSLLFRRYTTVGNANIMNNTTGTHVQLGAFSAIKLFVAGTMYGTKISLWGFK